ncbi:hypothetical protein C8T65DRAFT_738381 [Cerioporus squamosus]|nr:hypothetical protein C8T65DRAFT_738381 [Cerioporus squamosus]
MSSSQLYHRRSFFVGSPSHQSEHDMRPATSISETTTRDPLTVGEVLIMIILALCIAPAMLGSVSCMLHTFPLVYFQHQAPYSALAATETIHVKLTMSGSLITTFLTFLLWFAVEKTLGKSWIIRCLLIGALTAFPLAAGVAVVPSAAPAGFHVEHGLALGLWSLVPEMIFFVLVGALLKRLGCLPQFS